MAKLPEGMNLRFQGSPDNLKMVVEVTEDYKRRLAIAQAKEKRDHLRNVIRYAKQSRAKKRAMYNYKAIDYLIGRMVFHPGESLETSIIKTREYMGAL